MNDDDFPTDVCFTCGVSPTRAEARGRAEGYQQAIDAILDFGPYYRWRTATEPDSARCMPGEMDSVRRYLEHLAKERTP